MLWTLGVIKTNTTGSHGARTAAALLDLDPSVLADERGRGAFVPLPSSCGALAIDGKPCWPISRNEHGRAKDGRLRAKQGRIRKQKKVAARRGGSRPRPGLETLSR
jgi:hypothetical protein